MARLIEYKANKYIIPCPKCGNNTKFMIHSEQVGEDICDIWAVCKCGYDPTETNTLHRLEDVWGRTDDNNCRDAIDCTWNELLKCEG